MIMQITAGIKQNGVTAFMPNSERVTHWCEKRKSFEVVEHRGYICEAINTEKAMRDLLNMVRALNPSLSDLVMAEVNYSME
jgi:hypothetical protein